MSGARLTTNRPCYRGRLAQLAYGDVQCHFALWKTFRGIAITIPGIAITVPTIMINWSGAARNE
jgi:hypothetical protein